MDRSRTEPLTVRVSLAAQTLDARARRPVARRPTRSRRRSTAPARSAAASRRRAAATSSAPRSAPARPLNAVFRGRRPHRRDLFARARARSPRPRLDLDAHFVALRDGNRQQPAWASRYNAPLHLYPWHAGYGAAREPKLDRLHSHGESRHRRAVRSGRGRDDRGHCLTSEWRERVAGSADDRFAWHDHRARRARVARVAARRRRHPIHAQLRERRAARGAWSPTSMPFASRRCS